MAVSHAYGDLGDRLFTRPVPGPGYSAETRAGYLAAVIAGSRIAIDDPRDPDLRALLERHLEFALAQTPPEHSFALDAGGLLDPAITLFSIRVHGSLLASGRSSASARTMQRSSQCIRPKRHAATGSGGPC